MLPAMEPEGSSVRKILYFVVSGARIFVHVIRMMATDVSKMHLNIVFPHVFTCRFSTLWFALTFRNSISACTVCCIHIHLITLLATWMY
jgi:hypothetical protein